MSRGLRNNNPGNIRRSSVRYKGEIEGRDRAFKTFSAPEWGYRAMFTLLHTYRIKHRLDTIRKMIGRYAPPMENNTGGYVSYVAARSLLHPDQPLDTLSREHMTPLVAAMSQMENGTPAIMADIEKGWQLFIGDWL